MWLTLIRLVFVLFVGPFMAVGCGTDAETSSQVIAKVNDSEISIHQLNSALSQAATVPPEELDDYQRNLLEQLVGKSLLVEKAVEIKLDRDPNVMRAIEDAKSTILAQAYVARLSQSSRISNDDAQALYNAQPSVFANRKLYTYRQLEISIPESQAKNFRNQVVAAATLNELERWLEQQQLTFTAQDMANFSENIPLEQLDKMVAMEKDQVAIFKGKNTTTLVYLKESTPMPLSLAEAKPLLEKHWQKKNMEQLMHKELLRLKTQADIAYYGKFSDLNGNGHASDKPVSLQ
ncbi:EpsD family peptidyl-prolyl cis-trans isomerase [Neiella marina]|uniref:EpsD family peptidyl-prolyl cis-trans isomerase n=1 Tax=Neiella holothuriorum TaxID=2870530 RepID=A0ABS7EFL6_9GAMM|nr:EpsD family peptidyl-prolyl cis-trans isomerase [Neiella holothuriorum]MBW8190586.1 EpsD family peptidyl-prolyl cis-trans isomerase [Neiella holothuriorum]